MNDSPIRLRADALVVLAGPSGSGKSTWSQQWFRPGQVVSSDELRGVVGHHEHDLRASDDAFALLDQIVERRLARGLLTVVDTLGMDAERNARCLSMARQHGRPTHLVRFDTDAATCRRRNKARVTPVPAKVLTAQLATWADVAESLGTGFDHVHGPAPARVVGSTLLGYEAKRTRLDFGLLISRFDTPPDRTLAEHLGQVAGEAERAGFDSIWVMDHFMQIPQVGREWEPMAECYTTLSFLAARTERVGLGALVSCITHRNLGLLGKTVASLDVLSGGRARCGLGLGWFEREHVAFGYRFPPVAERYELLQDALEYLPLQWGPGAPPFEGRRFSTPEAIGYPRPLQGRVPILVGGSGERRTLALAAQYADACNVFGEPEVVAHKVGVLHEHCDRFDRDPAEVKVTQLSNVLVGADAADLADRIAELTQTGSASPEQVAERTTAGTVEDHLGRFTALADAGVDQVIVSLADLARPGAATDFGPVIDHFQA